MQSMPVRLVNQNQTLRACCMLQVYHWERVVLTWTGSVVDDSHEMMNIMKMLQKIPFSQNYCWLCWWINLIPKIYHNSTRKHSWRKVNARQQCVYEGRKKSTTNQRKEHNVEKYIRWVTTLLGGQYGFTGLSPIFIRLAVVAIPKSRNHAKFSENSNI